MEDPIKVKAQKARYYKKHRAEIILKEQARYRAIMSDPEKHAIERMKRRKSLREWRKNNPEKNEILWRRHNANIPKVGRHGPKPLSLAERFWSKVQKTESCWLWTGFLFKGYGQMETGTHAKNKPMGAHRIAMKLAGIDIAIYEGHHACPNKRCVRLHPEHVVPVLRRENPDNPTFINKQKTHCLRGHSLQAPNLIKSVKGRACRECHNLRNREMKRRVRGIKISGHHTLKQWKSRVVFYGWRCAYCRKKLTQRTLTKDHRIPISKGGTNWASNLVPACGHCNISKSNRKAPLSYGVSQGLPPLRAPDLAP